jgi:hypothetical protein
LPPNKQKPLFPCFGKPEFIKRLTLKTKKEREKEIHRIFGRQSRIEQQGSIFSSNYVSFQVWQERTKRTTAYERRIINYLRNHPNATLREARGHRAKRR